MISEEFSTAERKHRSSSWDSPLVCPGLSSPRGSRFGRLFGSGSGSSTTTVFPATDDDWARSIPEADATRPSIPPGEDLGAEVQFLVVRGLTSF